MANIPKRAKKFSNEFTAYKKSPVYALVKELYLTNYIKTIVQSDKFLAGVKINKNGETNKNSIKRLMDLWKKYQDDKKEEEQKKLYKFKTRDEAFSKIHELYQKNKPINGIIKMVVYGTSEGVTNEYEPDFEFKKIYGEFELNSQPITSRAQLSANKGKGDGQNRESVTGLIYQTLNKILGSDGNIVAGRFVVTVERQGVQYKHHLKTGIFNCVLTCIKEQISSFDEKAKNKLNLLNEKYFDSGVEFSDLVDIANKMLVFIKIYSRLGELLYSTHGENHKSKRQTIKCTLEKLDHVEHYEIFKDKTDKEIQYIQSPFANIVDIQTHFNESFYKNSSNNLLCKKDMFDNIKYYWNESTIYKMIHTSFFDMGLYYINSEYDLMAYEMDIDNNIEHNYCSKTDDEQLFNFINDSVHHPNEIYFNENIDMKFITKSIKNNNLDFDSGIEPLKGRRSDDYIECAPINVGMADLSSYYAYDRNKHYSHFDTNEYYIKHGIPACGKFNFYNVVDILTTDDIKILLSKVGFVQITDIKTDIEIINKLEYFTDSYIYPIPVIEFLINNNVSFKIVSIAINTWSQELILTEKQKTTKSFYTKFIGVMSINAEYNKYFIKCTNEIECLDLKATNTNENIKISYDDKNNLIRINELNKNIRNRAHIASYLLSYAMLEMLSKLVKIPFSDIIGVKVDCIILKKKYDDLFMISSKGGDYKYETKGVKELRPFYDFINIKSNNEYTQEHVLTFDKLRYNKINFITGAAGSGKTSRFYKKFDNQDERIKGGFSFPNNILTTKFKNEGYDITATTFHKFFNIGTFDNERASGRFINGLVDEVTMISDIDMQKIVKHAYENKINLFLIGDYDSIKMQSFQLMPPVGQTFLKYEFIQSDIYKIHLSTNHRQGTDTEFINFLSSARGLSNVEVSKNAFEKGIFSYITYDKLLKDFNTNDLIISPFNKGGESTVDKAKLTVINELIYNTTNIINCRFNKATKYNNQQYVNGETMQMSKEQYEKIDKEMKKKINLAFCQTSHTVQGLEYDIDKTLYVINSKYFTDNQLYVILSRAKTSKQIIFVNLN